MKYVLLGTLSSEWAARHGPRVQSSKEKLEQLGVKLEAVYYTQRFRRHRGGAGTRRLADFLSMVRQPRLRAHRIHACVRRGDARRSSRQGLSSDIKSGRWSAIGTSVRRRLRVRTRTFATSRRGSHTLRPQGRSRPSLRAARDEGRRSTRERPGIV